MLYSVYLYCVRYELYIYSTKQPHRGFVIITLNPEFDHFKGTIYLNKMSIIMLTTPQIGVKEGMSLIKHLKSISTPNFRFYKSAQQGFN